MIQRVQTIYLLLSAIVFVLLFFLPLSISAIPESSFFADQRYDVLDSPVLMASVAIGILLAIISIFLYKNRKLQRRMVFILIFVAIMIPALAYYLITTQAPEAYNSPEVHDRPGMFLSLLVVVLGILAIYHIRKDDKLVKSMDRLR